jgi:hypothetical protein
VWAPLSAGALAIIIVGALVAISGGAAVMDRPLWLDEVVTLLVARAPQGIVHAMRSGVDFQPPPYYMLVRMVDGFGGMENTTAARLPSVVAAALTVALVGYTLRMRLSLAAALAGALALAAHPLFIGQVAEARPYALWILATAVTAECLRANRRGAAVLTAIAAVALGTVHYFGILALASMGLAVAAHARLARRLSWPAVARAVAPLAVGAAALIALLPLARAQLEATGGRSYLPPATADGIRVFLTFIWGWHPALILLSAGGLMFVARRTPSFAARLPRATRIELDLSLVALLSTVGVPLLVVLVTLAYKPVLVLRYSVPAVLAMATCCAIAVETLPRAARWLAVLLLVRAALFSFGSATTAARAELALFASEAQAVRQLSALGIRTVSPSRDNAFRSSLPTGSTPGVAWLAIPDSLIERVAAMGSPAFYRNQLLVDRDFGRASKREFDFPVVLKVEDVRAGGAVALMRERDAASADTVWLPGRSACALSPRLVVYSPPASTLSCVALRAAAAGAGVRR